MNRAEYIAALAAKNARPPDPVTPDGQRFPIGAVVRITNPESWFAKRNIGRVFTVEYSYFQKFGSDRERSKNQYCLRDIETGDCNAWYEGDELSPFEEWPEVVNG